ncbi:TetR family transcriptional regulator [Gottschalkia acidurici 9a]|uniref:TetR family transcriptional regulator n=1 Tax=Gottschalkia acidurici (strain ATCC 7906 / DSM 604 / BCRC 14475 / CIP 104303 / KCTC 5404 / NCIMB 10678 / 9a) TaxID=1128398 RepID=K0B3B0_GOTA9|nr:TetR/AcrR family transcriptional regulator [Gottschalkia acidurici]AFS79914.1 TetR family transcriptional regulator [Gottschalkia acidurici 9a]
MKEKTDLRIIRSKFMIRKAFLTLLEEKGYHNITVTDISKKSMINRKTFYSHYETKSALYNEIVDDTLSMLEPLTLLKKGHDIKDDFQITQVIKILDNVKKQRLVFKILMEDTTSNDFSHKLKATLSNILVNNINISITAEQTGIPLELLKNVYSSIFIEIIKWWIYQNNVSSSDAANKMFSIFSKNILLMLDVKDIYSTH